MRLLNVKTKKSRRTVSLLLFAIRALQKHQARQAEERRAAEDDGTETRLVFTSPREATFDPQELAREEEALIQRWRLRDIGWNRG